MIAPESIATGEQNHAASCQGIPCAREPGILKYGIIRDQHATLTAKVRGHYAYFGRTGNAGRLRWYADEVERIWRKWLSRRDRRGRLPWRRLAAILKRHPLPPARIVHQYATASEALP